jgi:hypothetical protein
MKKVKALPSGDPSGPCTAGEQRCVMEDGPPGPGGLPPDGQVEAPAPSAGSTTNRQALSAAGSIPA